jgi:phosphopantetheinyl transferase (holo-ACP synthase)
LNRLFGIGQRPLISNELTKWIRSHKLGLRALRPEIEDHSGKWRSDFMELDKFLELSKKLDKKKKGKKEELEKFQKFFERFHLLNRRYMDKETYGKAQGSVPSIAEAIANTMRYLDTEIARLRNKRMKLPFENVELSDMQKIQSRNEMMIREYVAGFPE